MNTARTALQRAVSPALQRAIDSFKAPRGYLAVASIGMPIAATVAAQKHDLDLWASAARNPVDYDGILERTRDYYAKLVGVDRDRVASGSQTSVMASLVAATVPEGAEVLCVNGEFSSIVFPFLQRPGIRVRYVDVPELAGAITDDTWMVAFSHVQSSSGVVADLEGIAAAAALHGTYTFCDFTQSAGVHPVDASLFDVTVCHAYKWLCSPRGVAFLTVSERFQKIMKPLQAGWYAGEDVWGSCYAPEMKLAASARRYDVSPVWPSWAGAEPAIKMFSELDIAEIWARVSRLGDLLCDGLEVPQQHQAIVTWPDADGKDLQRLSAAGVQVSGRAGRLRASFHLWNDESDVEAVLAALR
jgi:selenocysteine lyase/cysteine desulfurase